MRALHDALQKRIDQAMAGIKDNIAEGGVKDYAEYRERCGKYKALKAVKHDISDVFKDVIEGDS